jgi:hypothetical protein
MVRKKLKNLYNLSEHSTGLLPSPVTTKDVNSQITDSIAQVTDVEKTKTVRRTRKKRIY